MTSNIQHIKTADVTNALQFFMELSIVLSADAEGYVYSIHDDNRRRAKIGPPDSEKPVVLYQEEIPKEDVYVINPFSAQQNDRTPPQVFFYKIQRAAYNARLIYAIDGILAMALERHKQMTREKTGKKDVEILARPDLRLVGILTRKVVDDKTIIDEVDDKMVDEFHKFFNRYTDQVLELVYKSSVQRTDIHIGILDDAAFVATLNSTNMMRKKSVAVLQTIIQGIFNLSEDETLNKFNGKSIEGAPSKLSSWLQALYHLYKPLNEVIEVLPDENAPDKLVDLDIYAYHLQRLPAYTDNAKWMIQGSPAATLPTLARRMVNSSGLQVTPQHLVPIQHTYNNPVNQQVPTGSAPPGFKLMPGSIMADGSRGPPIAVPDNSASYQPATMGPMTYMGQQQGMPGGGYMQQPQPYWGNVNQNQGPFGNMGQQPMYNNNPFGGMQQQNPMNFGPQPGFSGVPGMPILR